MSEPSTSNGTQSGQHTLGAATEIRSYSHLASPTASMASSAASLRLQGEKGSAPWWSFDGFARGLLVERKAIERERDEWEAKLETRLELLQGSVSYYLKSFDRLHEDAKACLREHEDISRDLAPGYLEARQEIEAAERKVAELEAVKRYFGQMALLIELSGSEEAYEHKLQKGDWRAGLEGVVALLGAIEADSPQQSIMESEALALITKRLELFSTALAKQIAAALVAIGWPKIQNISETTAGLVSLLQELLTYGEAAYLLARRLPINVSAAIEHPLGLLLDPIRQRFNYHFVDDPSRSTNRLDRPEWYLSHLQKQLRETVSFFQEFVASSWRLRGLDEFIREGVVQIARDATKQRLASIRKELPGRFEQQSLILHYLVECGKFEGSLRDEFGYGLTDREDESIAASIYAADMEAEDEAGRLIAEDEFVEDELERVKQVYFTAFADADAEDWNVSGMEGAELSPLVLKFMGIFHSSTVQPYALIPSLRLRAKLLYRVQSWLLEEFHNRCQFDCAPLHVASEQILRDIGMINSMAELCRVLRDEWGESLEIVELAASSELHSLVGYDPSALPGTVFNKALQAFQTLQEKLTSHVFSWLVESFTKLTAPYANGMLFYKTGPIEPNSVLPMSDHLRQAVVSMSKSIDLVKSHMSPNIFAQRFPMQVSERLAAYFWQGILLKNFFHASGADRFGRDIEHVVRELTAMLQTPANRNDLSRAFARLKEAVRILGMKERDATAPFDAARLGRTLRDARFEDARRFLEMERFVVLRVEDLGPILASRRHEQ